MLNIFDKGEISEDSKVNSNEIREILSAPPNGIIRWGITAIFCILMAIACISYFISYPEIIKAKVILTTYTPPASIVARSAGRLKLYVKEGQSIIENQLLCAILNSSNIQDMAELRAFLQRLKEDRSGIINSISAYPFPQNLNAGELQSSYLRFLTSVKSYNLFIKLGKYVRQSKTLNEQVTLYNENEAMLQKQLSISSRELKLAKKKFRADSILYKQNVLAELDFDKSLQAILQSERNVETSNQNITSNKIKLAELENSLTQLSLDQQQQISVLTSEMFVSYKELESQLSEWEQKYILKSPFKGTVAFFKYTSNNQFVVINEEIIKIVPESEEIFGEMQVPIAGSGKIDVGQRVNIKFDGYPYQEYGMVLGKVKSISALPRENIYSIQVTLNDGLTTTYKKQLPFRQEMQGNADIITKDLRLTQRILNQFKSLIDKTTAENK